MHWVRGLVLGAIYLSVVITMFVWSGFAESQIVV